MGGSFSLLLFLVMCLFPGAWFGCPAWIPSLVLCTLLLSYFGLAGVARTFKWSLEGSVELYGEWKGFVCAVIVAVLINTVHA